MKTVKKSKKRKQLRFFGKGRALTRVYVATAIFLCISAFALYKIASWELKPFFESKKSEVNTLPADVKKDIAKSKLKASPTATIRVPILLYHYVENVKDKRDTIRQSLNIPPYVFEQQVKTLADAGYTFMTARELGEVIDAKAQLPPKPVLLTFDDGHWDLATDILPLLRKYHAKATAYIVPGFIGGSDSLKPDQLREVIKSGLVEVGAHTIHHIALAGRGSQLVQKEVSESRAALEQDYKVQVVSFAYPNGSFDKQAIDAVKSAGFTTAVSLISGIEQGQQNRYYLYRLRPSYRTGQQLLNYLEKTMFQVR